jgi:hypothetical protein
MTMASPKCVSLLHFLLRLTWTCSRGIVRQA